MRLIAKPGSVSHVVSLRVIFVAVVVGAICRNFSSDGVMHRIQFIF